MEREYVRYASSGFEFLAAVGGFAWLGWLVDKALGIADDFPAFLLLGTFVGLALAIYRLMLKTGQIGRKDDDDKTP